MILSKKNNSVNEKLHNKYVNKVGSGFEGNIGLLCFSIFENIIDKMLFVIMTNFLFLFSFLFFLFLCSCTSTHNINVSHMKQNLDDLKVEYEEITLQPLNWEVNNEKMCLNNAEANKLYDNINNIRVSHYSVLGKYKASVGSFNVLKEVAYGDRGEK